MGAEPATLLYGGDGAFWGGFDACFGRIGGNLPEMVENTIGPSVGLMLHLEVPNWPDYD